jgi:hypothetical protein
LKQNPIQNLKTKNAQKLVIKILKAQEKNKKTPTKFRHWGKFLREKCDFYFPTDETLFSKFSQRSTKSAAHR